MGTNVGRVSHPIPPAPTAGPSATTLLPSLEPITNSPGCCDPRAEKKPRGKGFPPGPRVERVQRSKLAGGTARTGPCCRIKDLGNARRADVSDADNSSAQQPPGRRRDAGEVEHPAPADQGALQLALAHRFRGAACRRDSQPGADGKPLDVVVRYDSRRPYSMPMSRSRQTRPAWGWGRK